MRKFIFLLTLFTLISCSTKVKVDEEKKAIMDVMTRIEKAHYSKDANEFYAPYTDRWLDVRSGKVNKAVRDEELPLTQAYLNDMEFHELAQRGEPVIELSDDGKMAGFIGNVIVKGRYNKNPVFWVVAWQSVLRKIDDEWKIVSNANTEAGPRESAEVLLEKVRANLGDVKKEMLIYALATCEGPEQTFTTLIISGKEGGRMEQKYGNGHLILGHGEKEFMKDQVSGNLREELDTTTIQFIIGHELHWLANWPETRHSNFSLDGFTKFSGKDVFVVSASDNLGNPVRFYYDFDTYLPLGIEITPPNSEDNVVITLEEWQIQSGIQVFTKAIFKQGDEVFTYNYREINFNSDPAIIGEIKALID